jgi:VWFA-related protein
MIFRTTLTTASFWCVVAATLLASQTPPAKPPASGQQPPPTAPPVTYGVEVTLVEVDAVVTDGEGRVVRDLRKEDFEIFENGRPQTIDRVSFVEIPIERAGLRTAAARPRADVQTNLQRFDGRLYVLLLDDMQTSPARAGRIKSAARRFVRENLEPGDLATVVHVSGSGAANQDFTSDAQLLLASIERFQGRKARSETLNRIDEYNRLRQLKSGPQSPTAVDPAEAKDPDDAARAYDARRAFEAIATVSRRLAAVRGRRKALLWFGEAVAYNMFDLSRAQAPVVLESARAAVAAATRANLVIYGVDARGLAGLGEETAQLSGVAIDPASNLGASGLQEELRRSQDNLRKVSIDTGGFAVVNTDEFARAFDRVVMENSAYYLLGYHPAGGGGDGTYRKIDVKVKRPGASVRARSGYLAARQTPDAGPSGAPAPLRDALTSPVPQSALQMATHAAAFKGSGDKASVLVTVEYGAAAFEIPPTQAPSGDRLQASVVAVDAFGAVGASDHSSIGLDVKPQTRQAMKVLGFRTQTRLELRPGRYQLRVAGAMANGLVGSVHHDVEVPDFTASTPTMSDMVLTSIVAGLVPTAQVDERLRQVLPAPPSAMRDFRQDEAVAIFAETYEAGGLPARDVTFATTVRGKDGAAVFTRSDTRTADQLAKSNGGYSLQVPLRQFAPGDYSLRLEATMAGAAPIAREAPFRVWAVPAQTSDAAQPPRDLPIVVVARGAVSGVTDPRQTLARNAEELQALWGSLALRAPPPPVAFSNTMIAAVFLGTRPTAGYEAQVIAVRRDQDTLVVEWREQAPPDAGNPPAATTPFALVGVPMHAGPVRFERVP